AGRCAWPSPAIPAWRAPCLPPRARSSKPPRQTMKTVAVLDYGASNLRSVVKALEHASQDRYRVLVGDDAGTLLGADKVVFPGQGAIRQCMEALAAKELDDVLRECLKTKPFLGLCLGLQSLLDYSEEDGGTRGLGVIPGRVLRFP